MKRLTFLILLFIGSILVLLSSNALLTAFLGIIIVLHAGKFLGYALPKSYLPTGRNLDKIWESREAKGRIVFLLLRYEKDILENDFVARENISRPDIRFHMIFSRKLRWLSGEEINQLPERFNVTIVRRGEYCITPVLPSLSED